MMKTLLACAALLALSACASTDQPARTWSEDLQARGWQVGEPVSTVPNFRLERFEVLDDSHVVLHTAGSGRVLATLGPGCYSLPWSRTLAYEGSAGSLGRLDRLVVLGPAPVRMHETCSIEALHALQRANG
jgi:Family of unknown function (DUF6491)